MPRSSTVCPNLPRHSRTLSFSANPARSEATARCKAISPRGAVLWPHAPSRFFRLSTSVSKSAGKLSFCPFCRWPPKHSFPALAVQKTAPVRQPPGANSRGCDRPCLRAQRASHWQSPAFPSEFPANVFPAPISQAAPNTGHDTRRRVPRAAGSPEQKLQSSWSRGERRVRRVLDVWPTPVDPSCRGTRLERLASPSRW